MSSTASPRLRVGFTGTRKGMTSPQRAALRMAFGWLSDPSYGGYPNFLLLNGCAVGSDSQAADLVRDDQLRGYPAGTPVPDMALHKDCCVRTLGRCAVSQDAKPPLSRNADIVRDCDVLFACPWVNIKGGTGHTMRLAKLARKPVVEFWPDGAVYLDAVSPLPGPLTFGQLEELVRYADTSED